MYLQNKPGLGKRYQYCEFDIPEAYIDPNVGVDIVIGSRELGRRKK